MPEFTELAEMQFARLTSTQQRALLRRIFYTLEYDSEGAPGVEPSGDLMEAIPRLFGTYGVTFTNHDFAPTQFRYNDHRDARDQQCPHALQPAPPPDTWGGKIDPPWCPSGCLGSVIEGRTPDAETESEPATDETPAIAPPATQQADDTTELPDDTPAARVRVDNHDRAVIAASEAAS